MLQSTKFAAIAAVAMMGAVASADSIDLIYVGVAGGASAAHARVGSNTYYAGHMTHTIASGPDAGSSFNTFCIDFAEHANGGASSYEIIDLADAPVPGTPYGQAKADAVSAVIANAYAMGWIDAHLQADSSGPDYLARMGAIQAAVWDALGIDFQLNASQTSATLRAQYNTLMSVSTFNSSLRMAGLRAIVAPGEQDMLYVVPLPTSALAGLGMLGGIAGVRTARRRRA